MALIGQVFGQQGVVDQMRQAQASLDYANAHQNWISNQQAQQLYPRQGLAGLGSGGIQGASLTNKTTQPKKEGSVMDYMKGYFFKHRELLMGFTLVILLDHFIFNGAFREKTQRIVQALLDKTEKQLIG